jgi:hypothetical protein
VGRLDPWRSIRERGLRGYNGLFKCVREGKGLLSKTYINGDMHYICVDNPPFQIEGHKGEAGLAPDSSVTPMAVQSWWMGVWGMAYGSRSTPKDTD